MGRSIVALLKRRFDEELLGQRRPDAVLAIVPGMNHVLKEAPVDPQHPLASYGDPSLPLHPQLAPAVIGFLRTVR